MADPLASSRAGAPHRPKISPILGQSHGHGDRLERPHPSRMNTKIDLGLASAAPSSPASAANRVRATESLSARPINRLLQQNRHQAAVVERPLYVGFWGVGSIGQCNTACSLSAGVS